MLDVKNIKHNVIEANVRGEITETDMEKITTLYKEKVTKEEPINLLLVMEDLDGITIKSVLKDMEMAKYLKSLNKVALIGDKTWLKVDAKIENLMPGVIIKQFDLNEKENALNWVED